MADSRPSTYRSLNATVCSFHLRKKGDHTFTSRSTCHLLESLLLYRLFLFSEMFSFSPSLDFSGGERYSIAETSLRRGILATSFDGVFKRGRSDH